GEKAKSLMAGGREPIVPYPPSRAGSQNSTVPFSSDAVTRSAPRLAKMAARPLPLSQRTVLTGRAARAPALVSQTWIPESPVAMTGAPDGANASARTTPGTATSIRVAPGSTVLHNETHGE